MTETQQTIIIEDEETSLLDIRHAEMIEKLVKPFPKKALKSRKGGRGADLTYVEGSTVIRRLIAATGNNFNFEILKHEVLPWIKSGDNEQQLLVATVRLHIEGLGYRDAIGVQVVNARGGEDLFKGAVTDGLKKAATNFGVGLELYSPDCEGTTTSAPATATKDQSPERKALGAALRERGIATKPLADKAAMKDYSKPIDDLSQEQIVDWLNKLNVQF